MSGSGWKERISDPWKHPNDGASFVLSVWNINRDIFCLGYGRCDTIKQKFLEQELSQGILMYEVGSPCTPMEMFFY